MSRERVLIAGFSTRHVAASAKKAGFSVSCVDHFCDADLRRISDSWATFDDLAGLEGIVSDMAGAYDPDWFVPTSGAELLDPGVPLLGSPPKKILPFIDKRLTAGFFRKHGIPAPAEMPAESYPVFLKPAGGSGGWRNSVARSCESEKAWESLYPGMPYLRQEVLRGLPASVCCVADGNIAVAVATNEQILRGTPDAPFGFAGSVTPLDHPLGGAIADCAEQIAAASGLTGCIGIDFIVTSGGFRAIEVNPRFQGTVDTVEAATGVNLFRLHYNACHGRLPDRRPDPLCYAARRILFAEGPLRAGRYTGLRQGVISDIPPEGTVFKEGEAVISVFARGVTRSGCLDRLRNHITTVRQML